LRAVCVALQLLGLSSEIAGVLLMANGYTGAVTRGGVLRLLVSALVRGATAQGAASIAHLSPEDRLGSLQGLGLVGVGFVLQTLGTLLQLFA
jgi:hypothetical protein